MDVEMQSAAKIQLNGAIYAEESSDGENLERKREI